MHAPHCGQSGAPGDILVFLTGQAEGDAEQPAVSAEATAPAQIRWCGQALCLRIVLRAAVQPTRIVITYLQVPGPLTTHADD